MLDGAVRQGDERSHEQLSLIATVDDLALEWAHQSLLSQLLSRSLTGHQVRRAAEVLTDLEELRRRDISKRIAEHRTQFEGLHTMSAKYRGAPRSHRPATVTTQVCQELGFAKSMYSEVSGKAWAPATIAIHTELGDGFNELRRAVNGHVIPQGAAPREEEIVRNRRAIAVDYANAFRDTYRPLFELSRPHGYLAVPIVAAGQVRAILHADRHHIDIQTSDLSVLGIVGQMCAVVAEQEILRSTIVSRNRRIRDEVIAFNTALDELEQTELTLAEAGLPDIDESGTGGTCARLTPREYEVLTLVARGTSTAGIARHLAVSKETVKSHLQRIYRKLGVASRSEAAAAFRDRIDLHETKGHRR
ncbi:response regulator transcription factor [Rhodococcus erythropolis]|uniref:response regulator transcription factor n=1 Tax=Rhodococcus erythropolis TaxID=1833 RepID=UPI0037BCAE50